MKSYQEVIGALAPQEAPQDLPEEIPEELSFRAPPLPGSYRFRLPTAIGNCFDVLDVAQRDEKGEVVLIADPEKPGQTKPATYQRINLILDGVNGLVIEQAPPGSEVVGEPFSTRISNAERNRYVGKGLPMVKVSDMTYLLRALAPDARPRTNQEFLDVCLATLPGKQFGADVEWNGYCNPTRDAEFAFQDEAGATIYQTYKDEGQAENRKGCGKRVYSNKWPHDETGYSERGQCECGAWLRPFGQLARYKA